MKKYMYVLLIQCFISTASHGYTKENLPEQSVTCLPDPIRPNRYDFSNLQSPEEVFHTVYIDNFAIHPPHSPKDINRYLETIKEKLTNRSSGSMIFQYGNKPEIELKLPRLGIGRHGIVFEIIDKHTKTKRILKVNIFKGMPSLQSAIQENNNYIFWYNHSKKYTFDVAKMYENHPFGLYSIKEKNNGISLTRILINRGLIFITDKEKHLTSYRHLNSTEINDPQIQKISTAIFDFISVVKNNYGRCTSLSPNNIFIEFEKNTDIIKKIELIDYGVSFGKRDNYISMNNFNQYIELAAERLRKYIQNNYSL